MIVRLDSRVAEIEKKKHAFMNANRTSMMINFVIPNPVGLRGENAQDI